MSHNPPYYPYQQQNNQLPPPQQPQEYYSDFQVNHDLYYQNTPPPVQHQGHPGYSVSYQPSATRPHQAPHPQLDYGIPNQPYPYPPPTGYQAGPPPPQHQYQQYQNLHSGPSNPQNLGTGSPFPPSPVPTPLPSHSHSVPIHPAEYIPTPGPSQPTTEDIKPTAAPTRKITLNFAPKTTTTTMPRHSSDDYGRARPSRSSRAQKVSYADDADEEEFDDPIEEEDDDDEGDYQDQPQYHEDAVHKSSRTRRAPQRYIPEDDIHTSPIKPKRNGRSSRSHADDDYEAEVIPENTASRRKSFPPRPPAAELQNMFDDDDNGPPPPDTQETATDATPRKATRGKSRQSSEGSFEPDQSDVASQTGQSESDDPIAGFIQDDNSEEDALESDYGHPRQRQRQRQAPRRSKPRPAKRSTRSSARARNRRDEEEEDDDGIPFKKRLRERKSAVNYALPPADLSAEILQDAIATASRPGGSGRAGVGRANGVRFSGAAGKALPWSARGRDLAHAMGDPDTSDSVRLPSLTTCELTE